MSVEAFINYAISNVFCAIVFAVMLIHDLVSIDRQEKQLKYDHALVAFMLYYLSDAFWSAVDSGVIPLNAITAPLTNFLNYLFMAGITYTWLIYVLAVWKVKGRNKPSNRILAILPFFLATVALIITYIAAPGVLFDAEYKITPIFNIFLVGVPYGYIVAIIVFAIRKAIHSESRAAKGNHLLIGFFPLMVVICGLAQMIFVPNVPIFAYSGTLLMIVFYILSMEQQISTDPLTNLNNRGQLTKYSQGGSLRVEGKFTFVMMIDINDFKLINDTFGHAEGDAALIMVAQSLVAAVSKYSDMSIFLGRYGGDEFVLVVHADAEVDVEALVIELRENVRKSCVDAHKKYVLSIGVGFDQLMEEPDTFAKCLQRADSKLYIDKEHCKISGNSTKFEE